VSAIYDKPINKLKSNPDAWKVVVTVARAINEFNREMGLQEQTIEELTNFEIVIDENTSEEEAMMQYIAYFLRRGYSLEEAEKEALELKQLIESL
jgi:hypothetical protein